MRMAGKLSPTILCLNLERGFYGRKTQTHHESHPYHQLRICTRLMSEEAFMEEREDEQNETSADEVQPDDFPLKNEYQNHISFWQMLRRLFFQTRIEKLTE